MSESTTSGVGDGSAFQPSPRLRRWQGITLGSLTVGYAGYYFCRANLSVAAPFLLDGGESALLDKSSLGIVVSVGVAVYAIGKLVNGALCDFVGGRRMFLAGMLGSALVTLGMGWVGTSASLLAVAWGANRFFQSMGWGAVVKVAARWFEPRRLGTVMAVLALSYLFGDAVAKLALGQVVEWGADWQGVFLTSSGVLGVLSLALWFLLKESPGDVGAPEPRVAAGNLFGERGDAARPESLLALVGPLLRSPSFLLVCVMSFGLTVIRETFNFWTPTYLVEFAGADAATAAQLSAVFPFFGGCSILAAGALSDRIAGGARGGVMVAFLVPAVVGMVGLATLGPGSGTLIPTLLVSLVGFSMTGPYAFLSGVIAVDLGGKTGSSTVAGIADSVGYFGSIASGWGVGALAERQGWGVAFGALGLLALVTAVAAAAYWRVHERGRRSARAANAGGRMEAAR